MSTTANNNQDASSSSSSASINSDHSKERLDSLEEKFDKLFTLVNRFMKQPINSSDNYSVPSSKRDTDDSDTEDEDREERTDTDSVPTDYQLSDTLLDQYKVLINNQGLLVEEECILKKSEISEMNKVFSFPSNLQVNVAPFGTPEGITASSNLKNNDADLFIVEKRINDTLKPLFLMLNMTTHDSANVDVELIRYLAESAIILTVNAQASLGRVRRNNISKEIYGSEVLQPIKIKDTPKMFDETETERVRKLAKSIRKNNEAKQSLLKINSQSKSTFKKSGGSNTNGNSSSNSKPNSGSSGRSNNFNGSASSVASEEQEVNLPVGGRLFHFKKVWKELGLPSFCQEVVSGLKVHVLPNFKPVHNPIPISIPEGPKSECITKEVQDLLVDDAIEQVLPTQYSKLVFYSNVFTVPKPGTNLLRPVLDLKRLNTFIANQSFKMEGIKNLPSMVKQGYYMVKLDIKKAYLHVLVDPHYRDLFRFVWNGVHYRWKTMPFGLSTAPRIFTMLLRPVLRMLRELNVSVIAYLDDLLIVGSTKEECLSNLNKTMELLLKLGFKLNLEKSVLEPTQSITFLGLQIDSISMQLLVPKEKKKSVIKEIRNFLKLDSCTPRKLAGLKGKLIALKDAVIPFRLYTRKTNKFHCQCLSLSNGDWDQSFIIPQDVKSEISNWLTLLTQWNGKEISLFPSYDYILTTDASESDHQDMVIPVVNDPIEHVIKSSRDARSVNGLSSTMSESQQLQTEDSNRQHNNPFVHQSPRWSNPRSISPLRTALEAVSQEESQLDWRAHSRILQCQSRPPQPSCRVESQVIQDNQELQLETQEGSVQPHSTSVRSNSDGSVCISPQPSNDQLLHNQNERTPTRLESMEAVSSISTSNTFAFCPGEDQLIEFDEGFYNTDIPGMEISNLVSDDSKSSSSSSSSSVSSSSGYIPRSTHQRVNRVNTYSDSTTMEVGDYSTFQSHVKSIINTQKPGTTELFMSSWQPSTLKVYDSNYSRFFSFCMKNSLDPSDITLVVFMNYLTYLFNLKPPLAYSTINSHRSMLNQLLSLKNQTDIAHDPFITRIMTGIHKLRPASAKYNEIWDANLVFRYLSTINIYPKFTFNALLHKTLVLCKMFGLARSSDLVKWSFKALKVTTDSIKGPVINAKEQRNTKNADISILELTSLEDANLSVCPVRHLATYLRSSSKKRTSKSGDSVFIHADGTPLQVDDINKVVISTLSKSGIDVTKFKSHSTRSAMASLLLSNNVPFHVVKKMGRWKSNDTVDTFYDKKIIGEKSGGFLNTVVQLS
ncbi:hypothetical protein ACTFIV_007883 [Dictyostelium citrinum]